MPDNMYLSRRQFHAHTVAAAASLLTAGRAHTAAGQPMIEPGAMLIGECRLAGEMRADDVVPAHPNGVPVSRDRWLLVYATRGFRGVDDDRSIVWQLRVGAPGGPVLKEGMLARSVDDWEPLDDGKKYVKQHGHPVVFGVPRGAVIGGRPAPHANVFAAKWRVVARALDPQRNYLEHGTAGAELRRRTQGVEWVQFRLNDREDDIEIIQPAAPLRQRGFESGPAFCSAAVATMNQSFTPPVPFNRDASEWADCNHFDGGRVAALKYVFNAGRGRYEWTATGPLLGDAKQGAFEASLARRGDQWLIAARPESGSGVIWARTEDPFTGELRPVLRQEPASNSPRTVFRCADGVVRLFAGDGTMSPYRNGRDPLYVWDVDADFACSNRRAVFDSVQSKLPIRPAAVPKIDMCKLLPPQGRTQLVVFRVSVRSYNHPYVGGSGKPNGIPAINAEEKACCGIYYARLTYDRDVPAAWEF